MKATAEEDFGPRREALCDTQPLQTVPPEYRRVGAEAKLENEKGEQITLIVTAVKDNKVTLDGNYPFAGRPLVYRLRPVTVDLPPPH